MRKGHLIVIEGTDGCGKATQVKLLRKRLQTMDIAHQVVAFPRYTDNPYAKLVGKYLHGDFGEMNNETGTYLLSLAYAGDRFLAKDQIRDWLKMGNMVISDRYVPSNKVFMSAKLPDDRRQAFIDWLDDLEYSINDIPREELVIVLYVPTEIAYENNSKKGARAYTKVSHDLHEENLDYQKESSKLYLQLARHDPNWVVIECTEDGKMKTPEQIHEDIFKVLKERKFIK